jgi:hypothetical protein
MLDCKMVVAYERLVNDQNEVEKEKCKLRQKKKFRQVENVIFFTRSVDTKKTYYNYCQFGMAWII